MLNELLHHQLPAQNSRHLIGSIHPLGGRRSSPASFLLHCSHSSNHTNSEIHFQSAAQAARLSAAALFQRSAKQKHAAIKSFKASTLHLSHELLSEAH